LTVRTRGLRSCPRRRLTSAAAPARLRRAGIAGKAGRSQSRSPPAYPQGKRPGEGSPGRFAFGLPQRRLATRLAGQPQPMMRRTILALRSAWRICQRVNVIAAPRLDARRLREYSRPAHTCS
jgi:hypothetical protein